MQLRLFIIPVKNMAEAEGEVNVFLRVHRPHGQAQSLPVLEQGIHGQFRPLRLRIPIL
jgi:hypothetical protein